MSNSPIGGAAARVVRGQVRLHRSTARAGAVPVGGPRGVPDAQERDPGLRRRRVRRQPGHRQPPLGPAATADRRRPRRGVPDPTEVVGRGTVLVDGTVCPTWDWRDVPDLFCAKTGYPGMNLQIAATLAGPLAAVGPVPVHGARHDAYAFEASGLAEVLTDHRTAADLGYVGVEGIDTVPYKRFPGIDLNTGQVEFNTALSKIRAAVEHAIAHLKTWRMLSEEGGRYRAPLEKYPSVIKAVIGLFFFAAYE